MSSKGFTLGELLGAKTRPCKVRGCTRTWADLSGSKALPGVRAVDPNDETAGMCEPCRTKWLSLSDSQLNCSRPTCTGRFPFTRQDQMDAWMTGRKPPRRLCDDCQATLAGLEPKVLACCVPGCTRTGLISPQEQLMSQGVPAQEIAPHGPDYRGVTLTGPFCDPCADVATRIQDRGVNCGINGCKRKWVWKADEQIVAFAAGKPPEPPRRMCEPCRVNFGKLSDREVRCRASGCKNTWTWGREDQLDACSPDKGPPKAPAHLCERCFKLWSGLRDVERPCRQAGCTRTWTDRRGAQLARALRGKTGDPYPQYCEAHAEKVDLLADREIPCKTDGCTHTWTWTRQQQLAAGVEPPHMDEVDPPNGNGKNEAAAQAPVAAGEPPAAGPIVEVVTATPGGKGKRDRRRKRKREVHPPARHCQTCAQFLAEKKTIEIPCQTCSTAIFWPPESQLQTFLGHWPHPSICGACKRDATEAARQAAREALRAHPPIPGLIDKVADTVPEPASEPPAETTPESPST